MTQEYARSANAWDTLADAYEATGRSQDALRAARKALELLPADDSLSDAQRQRLEQAEKARIAKLQPAS